MVSMAVILGDDWTRRFVLQNIGQSGGGSPKKTDATTGFCSQMNIYIQLFV